MSAFGGLWKFKFAYQLNHDNHGKSIIFSGLWEIKFTYQLGQDNDGENVSVPRFVKDQIHVPTEPGKPRGESQHSVACEK